jgi:hypothetical protein
MRFEESYDIQAMFLEHHDVDGISVQAVEVGRAGADGLKSSPQIAVHS